VSVNMCAVQIRGGLW